MIVAANWKMNMGFKQAVDFLSVFKPLLSEKNPQELLFFPPASLSLLFQKQGFYWGGQNVYSQAKGAFTGENSAQTLKEMGASFCLLGHSERRWTFGETDIEIEKKFSLLQNLGLIPLLCVGESLAQRFDQKKILKTQLSWIKSYKKYEKLPLKPELLTPAFRETPLIVAYEPLWSIGTGDIPSTSEIQQTTQYIKEYLDLPQLKVFYGGSVTKELIQDLAQHCPLLDGVLVGGASLNPTNFYEIYKIAQKLKS